MFNKPSLKQLSSIPKIGKQDGEHTSETIIHAHIFGGSTDIYISEYDGADLLFGFTILNGDIDNAEWGYSSFQELCNVKLGYFELEWDIHWTPTKVKDIPNIVEAGGCW